MIKQKELCEKWAMDAGQISRMVKRGMPLTSEADAMKWRLATQQKAFRKSPNIPESQEESESQDTSNEDFSALNTLGRLLRAQRMEVSAFRLLARAAKDGNAIATRSAIHAYERAQKVVRQAEIDHANEQAHLRQTIPLSEVQEKYQKYLGGIRQLLDAMPSSICARANPSDPECAKQAIEDAVNQIYLAIQKAEGAFA
jgi:hypothetical protein